MSLLPGSAAAVIAIGVAALLLPSFVAGHYRRHGELRIGTATLRFAVLLYATGLACYVLPPVGTSCFPAQLRPLSALTSTAGIEQFVCNIALFVPLGALLRRAPAVTALTGAGLSVFVEATQLTGLWFQFPCSYRVFDVDDVIANTAGSLLGSFLAPLLRGLPSGSSRCAGEPRPVSAERRLLAMCCDVLLLWWLGVTCVHLTGFALRWSGVPPSSALQAGAAWLAPSLALLGVTRRGDGTPGQRLVLLRARSPGRLAVVLRWALGTGGLALLQGGCELLRGAPSAVLGLLWCCAHAVGVICDRDRRGITGRLAGLELSDVRGPETARTE